MESFGPYHAALLLSALTALAVALDTARRPERPGGAYLVALLVAAAVWASGQLGRELASASHVARAFDQLTYVGIVTVVLFFFLFTLTFAGRSDVITRRLVALLLVEPAALLTVIFSNPAHGLFWNRATGEVTGLFWMHTAYSYVLLTVGTLLLVRAAVRTRRLYLPQFVALVVGVVVPWLANALLLFGPLDTDYTAVAFSISGLCLVVATRQFGFMDVVPVAREALFATIDDPAVVLDDRDRLLDANPAFESTFDVADLPVGQRLSVVLSGYPTLADQLPATDGDVVTVDLPDGSRTFRIAVSPVRDEHGRRLGRLVLLRDETAQRRRQRELERQNEQLDRFASILSHDIRNPLSVAAARLELARETGDLDHLEAVEGAHDRMERLVDDALALARQTRVAADFERVDLEMAVRDAWMHVDSEPATLSVDVDGRIVADPGGLSHLLENLLANAVEHAGPDVAVTVAATDEGFAVADDGPGISPDRREEVFEPGYSGADDGTGLGLAIVRTVADVHGWTVEVDESDAGGTRFAVTGVEWADEGA